MNHFLLYFFPLKMQGKILDKMGRTWIDSSFVIWFLTHLFSYQFNGKLAVIHLYRMNHLERSLSGKKLCYTFGRKIAHLSETLSLPPFGIGRIHHSHHIAGSIQVEKPRLDFIIRIDQIILWKKIERDRSVYLKLSSSNWRLLKLYSTTKMLVGSKRWGFYIKFFKESNAC